MTRHSLYRALFAASALLSATAIAAPAAPKYAIRDNSPETLIDAASAQKIWTENLPATPSKNWPVKKYGYLSEVNGGFDPNKNCVVVARAMLVPLGAINSKTFVYDPKKTSVAFGTQAGATAEQCSTMAKAKLKEAVQSVASSLNN
jgi:hypothetical protein